MKDSFDKILTIVYFVAALLSPIIGGTVTFNESQDTSQSIKTGLIILAVFAVVGFVYSIAQKVTERWVGRTAESLDDWLQTLFSGFRRRYFRHVVFRHRDFDVKGLSTQGVFTLELDRVFVELSISPQASHRASANIIAAPSEELYKGSHVIWDYLASKRHSAKRLVILGAPGSGKTTLLKNIALVLANRKSHRGRVKIGNKIPVLLFLRDHAEAISTAPDTPLPKLIEHSLAKYQVVPPPHWFEKTLKKGSCIVMLDGLDEVADPGIRHKVVTWTDKQMLAYPNNHFVVTSRPFGYRENQLNGVSVLEVIPFSIKQVKQFIDNWYLANEIQSHQKDDEGVRLKATEGAGDLFTRLQKTSTLLELAVNPLLLTMIATVHRYRSSLPGRRVELYKEICEVFLGKRQSARGLELPLTPAQKQSILQPLAYHMMRNHLREIDKRSALDVFAERLRLVSPQSTGEEFLQMIENLSGLLLERENGVYGFAHKTFQEYLASAHALEQGLESELVSHIEDDWWHECIRLYSAQSDATPVIDACLAKNPPSALALTLAIACEDEAREVHPDTRRKLEDVLFHGVESKDDETRRVITEALLTLHIRHMTRIDDNTFIGRRFVNHAEYQMFLDEMEGQNKHREPDHWMDQRFPQGRGLQPIAGVRASDAVEFCDWLTSRENGEWRFRLPLQSELSLSDAEIQKEYAYWISEGRGQGKALLYLQTADADINPAIVESIMAEDLKIAQYMDRLLGLDIARLLMSAIPLISQILGHLKQASYHDLGADSITYERTPWSRASALAQLFSGLINDANTRMSSFGAKLNCEEAAKLSQEIAGQIHDAHDWLRGMYLPGAYAPDRADKSAKSAAKIQNLARGLAPYIKQLETDIANARNLSLRQARKMTGELDLPLAEVTDFAVKLDPSSLRTILSRFRLYKNHAFMNLFDSDYPGLPAIKIPLALILSRDSRAGGPHENPTKSTRKLLSWYLRVLSILVMEKFESERRLPDFLMEDTSHLQPGKAEMPSVVEGMKNLCLHLVLLEGRAQRRIPAMESLRIVRERVQRSIKE